MTGKERFLTTLRFQEPDRPPHFESMFELEQEAFGLKFPDRGAWGSTTGAARDRLIGQCMAIYEQIVATYEWDALAVYWPWSDPAGVAAAKRTFGDDIAIGGMCGRGVWSIESITDWTEFSIMLFDRPEDLHAEAESRCQAALEKIDRLVDAGADFVYLPNDVAYNEGPFVSPKHFSELVTPYLRRQVARVHEHGAIAIIHSDGNLMPVFHDILSIGADGLQSIDPMAGMDIAEVKRHSHGQLALMGNVQCNLMQDGPLEAITASARYCLEHGAPGGGYIFSTSNTIFPGMPLAHYEHMLAVFRKFCSERENRPT